MVMILISYTTLGNSINFSKINILCGSELVNEQCMMAYCVQHTKNAPTFFHLTSHYLHFICEETDAQRCHHLPGPLCSIQSHMQLLPVERYLVKLKAPVCPAPISSRKEEWWWWTCKEKWGTFSLRIWSPDNDPHICNQQTLPKKLQNNHLVAWPNCKGDKKEMVGSLKHISTYTHKRKTIVFKGRHLTDRMWKKCKKDTTIKLRLVIILGRSIRGHHWWGHMAGFWSGYQFHLLKHVAVTGVSQLSCACVW